MNWKFIKMIRKKFCKWSKRFNIINNFKIKIKKMIVISNELIIIFI